MEPSLSLQAGQRSGVEAAILALQGWQRGCFPCGHAHCMHGCPICGAAGDQAGRGLETFLVEDTLQSAMLRGEESSASLNCSLSSLLKCFSLTGLVLCFCTSPPK